VLRVLPLIAALLAACLAIEASGSLLSIALECDECADEGERCAPLCGDCDDCVDCFRPLAIAFVGADLAPPAPSRQPALRSIEETPASADPRGLLNVPRA
jgi:hypothetical protein